MEEIGQDKHEAQAENRNQSQTTTKHQHWCILIKELQNQTLRLNYNA